jgi:glycosyltransferase involved in cell wall biosynthesis
LSGDLKWGAFHAAEVFVLPSHQENFGIAVAEALACGVPALISNKVNIWREVQDDGAGLVESDDATGTCRLLERWLNLDKPARQAMRQRARTCFETRFEIRKAAANLLETFRSLNIAA